jgi:hypothetical protein
MQFTPSQSDDVLLQLQQQHSTLDITFWKLQEYPRPFGEPMAGSLGK